MEDAIKNCTHVTTWKTETGKELGQIFLNNYLHISRIHTVRAHIKVEEGTSLTYFPLPLCAVLSGRLKIETEFFLLLDVEVASAIILIYLRGLCRGGSDREEEEKQGEDQR